LDRKATEGTGLYPSKESTMVSLVVKAPFVSISTQTKANNPDERKADIVIQDE